MADYTCKQCGQQLDKCDCFRDRISPRSTRRARIKKTTNQDAVKVPIVHPNVHQIIVTAPIFCPACGMPHVDEERDGEKWQHRAHTTHRCQHCGADFDVYVSGAAP